MNIYDWIVETIHTKIELKVWVLAVAGVLLLLA